MDKKLFIHLQGGRKVSGVLRGYDLFLNLVIDDALEETTPAQKHPIGTVVRPICIAPSVSVQPIASSFPFFFVTVGHPRQQCNVNGDSRSYSVIYAGYVTAPPFQLLPTSLCV